MNTKKKRTVIVVMAVVLVVLFFSSGVDTATAMKEVDGEREGATTFVQGAGGKGGGVGNVNFEGTPPPSTPEPESTPEPTETPPTTSVSQIFHFLDFPFETLVKALVNSLTDIFSGMYTSVASLEDGSLVKAGEAITKLVFGDLSKLTDIRKSSWEGTAKVTSVLLPVFFLLTVSAAMKEGVTSITGYSNAREALMQFFISVGAAAASYLLINLAISLSGATARGIGEIMKTSLSKNILIGLIVKPAVISSSNPLIGLFLSIFVFIFVVAVIMSVSLAFLASEVVLLLLVAVAPMVIMMGAVQPLRWLSGLWTKALVVILLLKPINVLLLSIGTKLQFVAAELSTGIVVSIVSVLVMIGVASVLVALNTMVGKMVYGAAMEVARKAWGATKGVMSLAALGAGIAIGPSIAGAVSSGFGGGGVASAAGPALGKAVASGIGGGGASAALGAGMGGEGVNPLGVGGPGGMSPSPGLGGSSANNKGTRINSDDVNDLSRRVGAALSASGNPIAKGLGMGLQLSGAGRGSLSRQPASMSEPMIDHYPGLEAAEQEMTTRFSGDQSISPEKLPGLIGAGTKLGKASLDAAQAMGVPIPRYLTDLGYKGTLDQAGAGYMRAVGGRMAFHGQSPWQAPVQSRYASPKSMSVYGAVEIIQVRNEAGAASQENISNIASMIYQRHTQLGETIPEIVKDASNKNITLGKWLDTSYEALPSRPEGWDPSISEGK